MILFLTLLLLVFLIVVAVRDYRRARIDREMLGVLLNEVYKPLSDGRLVERDVEIERAVLRCVGVLSNSQASYKSKLSQLRREKGAEFETKQAQV